MRCKFCKEGRVITTEKVEKEFGFTFTKKIKFCSLCGHEYEKRERMTTRNSCDVVKKKSRNLSKTEINHRLGLMFPIAKSWTRL